MMRIASLISDSLRSDGSFTGDFCLSKGVEGGRYFFCTTGANVESFGVNSSLTRESVGCEHERGSMMTTMTAQMAITAMRVRMDFISCISS